MAVVSQPDNREARVKAPGQLDHTLGEFWVENPWDIYAKGHNLSAYERKRYYLNVPGSIRGRDFIDISYLTGADNDGDGRCMVGADFRNNGRLDVVLRQVGGGPLMIYENNFPQRHYLKVSLRGVKSNKLGIGARLVATAKGQQLVREQFPVNSFRSQAPNVVHFGLGDAENVERLVIRWPSGQEQELKDVKADRHIVVTEAKPDVETVVPGRTIVP